MFSIRDAALLICIVCNIEIIQNVIFINCMYSDFKAIVSLGLTSRSLHANLAYTSLNICDMFVFDKKMMQFSM